MTIYEFSYYIKNRSVFNVDFFFKFIFGCVVSSCCAQAFSGAWGANLVTMLLIAVASLVAEHGP